MNFNERSFVNGDLKMITRLKEDQAVIDEFDESNVITAKGASDLIARITKNDSTVTNTYIQEIVLGTDVGSGDLLSPESANETYESSNQTVIYTVPFSDITITYPDPFTFEVNTVLDGTAIMNSLFPSDIEMRFSSSTLRYSDDVSLAYKRFPVRSLSRLVDIEIRWTISLKEQV